MDALDEQEIRGRAGSLYGAFAFGSVTVSCYAGAFGESQGYDATWRVPVVYALGAAYAVLGVLSGIHLRYSGPLSRAGYYAGQCAMLTAIIGLSPVRGFVGILVLPLMSQAIFNLGPWRATAVSAYLFGINLAPLAVQYGWRGAREGVLNYATAFAFTGVFTIITKRALVAREREEQLRREVEAANRQLREHATQAEELATTRERNRVAREMHDGVGHYLTVVKTQLDAAAALLPAQPERAREAVTKAARLAGDALDDVRRSVAALRTDAGRPPLPEALGMLAHEAGAPVAVRVEGKARALPPGVEHALFRSAQEGLTNVRKHAGASTAEVALDFRTEGRVRLAVIDNGRGARGADGATGGFGLRGIRERIEVLGGRVESGNRREGGFRLTVEVPG